MKAILCTAGGELDIFSFRETWTACCCNMTIAKWLDPDKGTVVVAARKPWAVKFMGLSNTMLVPALAASGTDWPSLRDLHDKSVDAPGYVFDKSQAECWAVIVSIGTTSDTRFATLEEYEEAFGLLTRSMEKSST